MPGNKYDNDWFKDRAIRSLTRIEPGAWDYSDSLLLYISDTGSETYELLQASGNPYFNLVTQPEREYLAAIANDIAQSLPNEFEYIDLGPGTEHKEQFLFKEFQKLNKNFVYYPVDISEHFLNLAKRNAVEQGINSNSIQSSFEELPLKLGKSNLPRFVSLGLTFSNYAPKIILPLLMEIAGDNGFIFINSQMRDRIDMEKLVKIYGQDAAEMCDEKLRLIGLEPKQDVTIPQANEGIEVWCSVIKANAELHKLGIKENDRLLVFQSLRYTKKSLEDEIQKFSGEYRQFDRGSSFIGTLIKT